MAIPTCQDRVSPLLDVATRLSVIDVDRGSKPHHREVVLLSGPADQLARSVAELKVHVLICGALSRELEETLGRLGVRVIARICGSTDEVIRAFLNGQIRKPAFQMPGCGQPCGSTAVPAGAARFRSASRSRRARTRVPRPHAPSSPAPPTA